VLVQIAGAIAASIAVWAITGRTFAPAPGPGVMATAALLVEVLYTFSLALVVLNVATATATAGNSFYGLAIGFAIVVGAFAGGPISGGAFNPAVGIGPTIVHAMLGNGTFGHVWLYIVGPLVGAVLAALAFRAQAQA
jgi:aquaporin Z